MALLFFDGYESYNSATVGFAPGRWDIAFDSNRGFPAGRYGGQCSAMWNAPQIRFVPEHPTTVIVGVAFQWHQTWYNNDLDVISIYDGVGGGVGTEHLGVHIRTPGDTVGAPCTMDVHWKNNLTTLFIPSAIRFTMDRWCYVELKAVLHATLGSVELRVDGNTVGSATNINTVANGNAFCGAVGLATTFGGPGEFRVDDFYICDDTGPTNSDFLGEVRIYPVYPNGNGAQAQFTSLSGPLWDSVNDVAGFDSDTTYNYSSTPGQIDTFLVTPLPAAVQAAKGVQTTYVHRKDDAGVRNSRGVLRVGGINYDTGVDVASIASYAAVSKVWPINPNTGLPWTISDVNAMEIGYKIVA